MFEFMYYGAICDYILCSSIHFPIFGGLVNRYKKGLLYKHDQENAETKRWFYPILRGQQFTWNFLHVSNVINSRVSNTKNNNNNQFESLMYGTNQCTVLTYLYVQRLTMYSDMLTSWHNGTDCSTIAGIDFDLKRRCERDAIVSMIDIDPRRINPKHWSSDWMNPDWRLSCTLVMFSFCVLKFILFLYVWKV